MMTPKYRHPCQLCSNLHWNCSPITCVEASLHLGPISTDFNLPLHDLKKSSENGCLTCRCLYNGIMLPEIKREWMKGESNEDASFTILRHPLPIDRFRKENHAVQIRIMKSESRFHFAFWKVPKVENAEEGDCAAFPVARSISEGTDSETSWSNLRTWLRHCDSHPACAIKGEQIFPGRILDVRLDVKQGSNIRLCIPSTELKNYVTLSHRWPKSPKICLKKDNHQQFQELIRWDELSKTFQEAISITRTLGIQYIWIDALCIIQDDHEDWEAESSKMCSIYQNSYLTIAASYASNEDEGCFASSDNQSNKTFLSVSPSSEIRIKSIKVEEHDDFSADYQTTSNSPPLHQRAWVLQERMLSPRVVYYMDNELVWECNTLIDCQCSGVTAITDIKSPYVTCDSKYVLHYWLRLVERYSQLDITFESDRLPAFSGLAQQAQAKGDLGRYIAGLWEKNIAHQMCWQPQFPGETRRPQSYIAPSWSWASILGAIKFPNRSAKPKKTYVNVSYCYTSLAGANPMGSVKEAYVRLSGYQLMVMMSIDETMDIDGYTFYQLATDKGDIYHGFVPDVPCQCLESVKVMIVPWCTLYDDSTLFMVCKSKTMDRLGQVYQRVGLVQMEWNEMGLVETRMAEWINQLAVPFLNITFV